MLQGTLAFSHCLNWTRSKIVSSVHGSSNMWTWTVVYAHPGIPIMWYFKMVWVVYFHIQIPGLHQARFIRPLKRVSLSMFLPQWTLMLGACLRCIKYLGRAIVDHPRAACHAEPNKVLFHSYDVSRNSYRSDIKKGSPMPRWSSTSVCLHEIWELLWHSGQLLCSIWDNCF